MIRCFFCESDAAPGWVCGVPTASERYKLALCPLHDNPKNRRRVEAAWEELIKDETRGFFTLAKKHAKTPVRFELHIHFREGGSVTKTCSGYQVSEEKDLLLLTEGGELEFYPLQHVRSFKAVELPADQPEQSPSAIENDQA